MRLHLGVALATLLLAPLASAQITTPLWSENFESIATDGLLSESKNEVQPGTVAGFVVPTVSDGDVQNPNNIYGLGGLGGPAWNAGPNRIIENGAGDDFQIFAFPNAWNETGPSSDGGTTFPWTIDDSQMHTVTTGGGVKEWEGWSFADRSFWVQVAGDQDRSRFRRGRGIVAVADNDEWDDRRGPGPDGKFLNDAGPDNTFGTPDDVINTADNPSPADNTVPGQSYFNAFMTTPSIAVPGGAAAGSLKLQFDSSWRDEAADDGNGTNNQTGLIEVSYDGGATFQKIFQLDSSGYDLGDIFPTTPFARTDATITLADAAAVLAADAPRNFATVPGASCITLDPQPIDRPLDGQGNPQTPLFQSTNETFLVEMLNPAGVTSVQFRFGMTNAGNDWWWAVDNLVVGSGAEVPEPSAIALAGMLVAGAVCAARRRSK